MHMSTRVSKKRCSVDWGCVGKFALNKAPMPPNCWYGCHKQASKPPAATWCLSEAHLPLPGKFSLPHMEVLPQLVWCLQTTGSSTIMMCLLVCETIAVEDQYWQRCEIDARVVVESSCKSTQGVGMHRCVKRGWERWGRDCCPEIIAWYLTPLDPYCP